MERNETPDASNHYNCPIVTSYSENIKNNVDEIGRGEAVLRNPFMAFSNLEVATQALEKEFSELPAEEIRRAARGLGGDGSPERISRKKGKRCSPIWRKPEHRELWLAGTPLPSGSGNQSRHS